MDPRLLLLAVLAFLAIGTFIALIWPRRSRKAESGTPGVIYYPVTEEDVRAPPSHPAQPTPEEAARAEVQSRKDRAMAEAYAVYDEALAEIEHDHARASDAEGARANHASEDIEVAYERAEDDAQRQYEQAEAEAEAQRQYDEAMAAAENRLRESRERAETLLDERRREEAERSEAAQAEIDKVRAEHVAVVEEMLRLRLQEIDIRTSRPRSPER